MKKGKVFTVILMGIVMTTGGKMTEFNTEVKADISSEFEIPQADEAGRIGASMPYLRYDSKDAEIGNGAKIEESVKSERTKIASQASQQSYVSLPVKNSYAEWTAVKSGSGSDHADHFHYLLHAFLQRGNLPVESLGRLCLLGAGSLLCIHEITILGYPLLCFTFS